MKWTENGLFGSLHKNIKNKHSQYSLCDCCCKMV